MYPMKNRHTGLVCRGLHKLKEELHRKQYKAVCKNGWYSIEEVKG